jgi:hypothetical protein
LGKEPEGEPVKKKPRIEVARLYLKSIGSAVKVIPIRTEPLSMITSEHSLQNAEEEATPHHPSLGRAPVLRDEDLLSAQPAGQDVTLTSMAGEEVAQTALPESGSALLELLSAHVETEVETLQVSQPEVAAEVGDDAGSIRAEDDSAAVGVSIGPSVYNVVDEAGPSSRTLSAWGPIRSGQRQCLLMIPSGFLGQLGNTNMTRPHWKSAWLGLGV